MVLIGIVNLVLFMIKLVGLIAIKWICLGMGYTIGVSRGRRGLG